MIDWRKPHRRRDGERVFDRIFAVALWLAILAVLLYGSWQFGRFFGESEARARMACQIEKAEKDLLTFKMFHYGQENFYLFDKEGRLRYVTKPGDLDNPKKWRRTR